MSQTHLVKKLSAMLFKKQKQNQKMSPIFVICYFFLQPRLNVYVLCDIQKQKH